MSELIIRYFRPPDRHDTYHQKILHRSNDVIVSLNSAAVKKPISIDGVLAVEPGAPIIWFTFPGEKYDVGRFHLCDGTFTGLYSDIMEPVRFVSETELEITDLFVDVWIADGKAPTIQDIDELEEAVERGHITRAVADDALAEAQRLVQLYDNHSWPPAIVNEWPISRVRENS